MDTGKGPLHLFTISVIGGHSLPWRCACSLVLWVLSFGHLACLFYIWVLPALQGLTQRKASSPPLPLPHCPIQCIPLSTSLFFAEYISCWSVADTWCACHFCFHACESGRNVIMGSV